MDNEKLTLLRAHFERIGRRLQAEGEAAKSFHHSLNKGQIREAFVREFLEDNTSVLCGIGTGEIIHASTTPENPRSQIDVVVYNKGFPKLSLATDIDIFFAETVSSFFEIKSTLTKADLSKTAEITKKIKSESSLAPFPETKNRDIAAHRPYSFVFAYDGPRKIETLLSWMKEVAAKDFYNLEALRETEPEERAYFQHLFIDGVFVLGRGYVVVDSLPIRSPLARYIERGNSASWDHIWIHNNRDELAFLWAVVNHLNWEAIWKKIDFSKYIGEIQWTLEE